MASPTRLNLLPFLQLWDAGHIDLRLLAVPRDSPLDPLISGPPASPSFAAAKFVYDVHLVKGLDQIPSNPTPFTSVIVTPAPVPQAVALFTQLAVQFNVDPAPPAANPRPAGTLIKKYLPPTYRQAVGFSVSRNPAYTVTDDSYLCTLRSASAKPPYKKIIPPAVPKLPWGKIIAVAMRQPLLAEALGLIRPLHVPVPVDFFKEGGWIFVTLAPASDAFGLTTLPDAIKVYATRVPALAGTRSLFSPVLFPVATVPPPGPYDDLFQEFEEYDDGFAKAVHAAQPQFLDPLSEVDDRSRPAKDLGIRLGWDDEQVAIWLNRQIDPAAAPLDAPMGVRGYRIDARVMGTANWSSLCRANGPVKVGTISVATFDGELGIETIPSQPDGEKTGEYWLPIYYTQWTGPSMVAVDTLTRKLVGDPDANKPNPVEGVDPTVLLRYGTTYDFRVRLMDHTGAGPTVGEQASNPGPSPTYTIPFRRWIRPYAVRVVEKVPNVPDPTKAPDQIHVRRPLLGSPEVIFTGLTNAVTDLLADIPAAKAAKREVALPDPDVALLHIGVEVQALGLDTGPGGGTDSGYHTLFETTRPFPANISTPLAVDLDWQDVKNADSLSPAPTTGPVPVPTARNVRLVLSAIARDDGQLKYFGADDVRFGATVSLVLRKQSSDERGLFLAAAPGDLLRAIFLQPDDLVDAPVFFAQKAAGKGIEAPANAIGRLAEELKLAVNGLTLHARSGRRVVFGASAGLRHILAPDASSIGFASKNDLARHWIVALRATIDRDWTWDGLAPTGVSVIRDGVGEVGRIEPRPTVNDDALIHPQRGGTDLVFFDVVDPKPEPGSFPAELTLKYSLKPNFIAAPAQSDPPLAVQALLPMTTPPSQIPRLVSAGIALSPYVRSGDYSSTQPRRRVLWLELDRPVDNPRDSYFARMLACAPDPLLLRNITNEPENAEPPLPVDSEPIRTIIPGQSDDRSGIDAMQRLISSDSPRHFMLPLPPGIPDDAPELFGFFTYEFRVGHDIGWSTAQGRFETALRVTGVQHPAPLLTCMVLRDTHGIQASAPFADPVASGRSNRPFPPTTEIYVLIYAQVVQSDTLDHRNVLLSHKPARFRREPIDKQTRPDGSFGTATWSNAEVNLLLDALLLGPDTPLSCLAVETLPGGVPTPDPLGTGLGHERFVRTSPLVPVPVICGV